jgi:hypothetical protein
VVTPNHKSNPFSSPVTAIWVLLFMAVRFATLVSLTFKLVTKVNIDEVLLIALME